MNFRDLYKQDNDIITPAPEFADNLINELKTAKPIPRRVRLKRALPAAAVCLIMVGLAIVYIGKDNVMLDSPMSAIPNGQGQRVESEGKEVDEYAAMDDREPMYDDDDAPALSYKNTKPYRGTGGKDTAVEVPHNRFPSVAEIIREISEELFERIFGTNYEQNN